MPIPRTDTELVPWLNNFVTAFAAHIATLGGFVEEDLIAVDADAKMLSYLLGDLLPTYKTAFQVRTSFKNRMVSGPVGAQAGTLPLPPTTQPAPALVPPGILPRLRTLVRRIQLAPGYTEEIGLALGIVGPEGGSDAPAKPDLKARSTGPGVVQIDFSKERFDGVLIESLRDGEDGWQSLGLDSYSPYIDERPPLAAGKPETRQYRARYILRDQATGEWSDIVTATFVP